MVKLLVEKPLLEKRQRRTLMQKIDKAVDDILIKTNDYYKTPCICRKAVYFSLPLCEKKPKEMSKTVFRQGCKHQRYYKDLVICIKKY